MTAVLQRMGRGDVTVHGFRSAFRDWTTETTGDAREVAEAALAHTVGRRHTGVATCSRSAAY